MRPRSSWLQTATRAYTLKTWTDRQHMATADHWLTQTARQHEALAQAMQTLALDWAQRPDPVRLAPELDQAHRRFHHHLAHQEVTAARTRQEAQRRVDAARKQLQSSHATWTLLSQVVERSDARRARDARVHERQAVAELWLLAQLAKETNP